MTSTRNHGEPVPRQSPAVLEERLAAIRAHFPEALSEGRVDFARLRAALGDMVDDSPERYTFSWAGKRDAIRLLQTPSAATLLPCPSESMDFDTTQNLFIEGDNLEVLKLLYKPYFGRVKMIYIDPPYNTGNDFVYPDNYADPLDTYLRLTGQKDAQGNLLTSNPETSGRYHSAWLSMMYPRLFLARQLLREDGVIFVSIDDNESYNLRMLMNEIFGEENFLACIAWEKRYTRSNNAKLFYSLKDSIVVYRKSPTLEILREGRTEKANSIYHNPDNDPRGPWATSSYVNPATREERPNLVYPIRNPSTGAPIEHPTHAWKYERPEHERHVKENRLWWGKDGDATYPRLKIFLSENDAGMVPTDLWDYESTGTTDEGGAELKALFGTSIFDNPKPTRLIRRMLTLTTAPDENDIVLDFFAGSATTAHAVLAQDREDGGNRRFIMVQLPEPTGRDDYATIADIGKERIRRVVARMKQEDEGKLDLSTRDTPEDLGFRVFKLAPSHYRPWQGVAGETADAYAEQMALFTDPLRPGWTVEGLIWEVALREGYGLNASIQRLEGIAGNAVYTVADPDREQSFTICLDDHLHAETLPALHLTREQVFVCRDAALDDELAANLALQCRLKTI